MKTQCDGDRRGELIFFGRIAASVSHEIKNKLAILKEEAGLLGDLLSLAKSGKPVDQSRFSELAEKISSRADAVDEIVKRLNQFAHTVDEPHRTFDLRETLRLMGGLCQRFAAMKRVNLGVSEAPEQVQITSNPFLVHNMLYLLMDAAMNAAGDGGAVEVTVTDENTWASFTFTGSFSEDEMARACEEGFAKLLCEYLGAEVTARAEGMVVLSLPKDLQDVGR